MVKRVIAWILFIGIIVICCISVHGAYNAKRFTSLELEMVDKSVTTYEILRDNDTGVCYLYIESESGCTITPMYNNDGSIYIANGWRDNE